MTNPQGGDISSSTIVQGSASQPIFGTGLDPASAQNISWEVSDGTIEDAEPAHEPEQVEPKQKEIPESSTEKEPQDAKEAHDEVSGDGDEETDSDKKKYKNRTPPAKRISDLTRAKKQSEALALATLRENEELKRQNQLLQQEKDKTNYNFVKTNADRLQYDLSQAIEEGDSAEQARLQAQLSEYKAELRYLEREAHKYTPPPQPQTQESHDYRPQEPHPYQQVEEKWLKSNSWADPESVNYDQEMHDEAFNYAMAITKQYKLEGRGEDVGTPEFFDEITGYVKETYAIPERAKPAPKAKEPMQMSNPGSNVTPVNRPSVDAESIKSRDEIVLTPEEKEVARSMKGTLRDERGKQVYDDRACEKAYLYHKKQEIKQRMKGR